MDEIQIKSQMQKALDLLSVDLASIRTGRSSPGLVESIELSVYGGTQRMKLREVASIACPDPQMILITPWDHSIVGEIRKGIEAANLGFNPSIDGEVLRIVLPPMTGEDREKYTKLVNQKLENTRVMIRQARGEAMGDLKKEFEAKEITEDERKLGEKKTQEITDEFIAKAEEISANKNKELTQL